LRNRQIQRAPAAIAAPGLQNMEMADETSASPTRLRWTARADPADTQNYISAAFITLCIS
jgi:hypothetical protein